MEIWREGEVLVLQVNLMGRDIRKIRGLGVQARIMQGTQKMCAQVFGGTIMAAIKLTILVLLYRSFFGF